MRILVSIGCNAYDTLGSLNGAEKDATDIFTILTDPDFGDYSRAHSHILLSPTWFEFHDVLRNALSAVSSPETLTIFFAGHGGAAHGSYYLCVRDTCHDRMSTTAVSLSTLFSIVNEVRPSQCNIIFDTCEGGGLVNDVGTLIKPELIGKAETPGIAIFASSAADQYSADTPAGGLGTVYLLRCLTGHTPIQSQRPYLDLVEVGRAASDKMVADGHDQTPVVWGINLYGQAKFAKNPHFDGKGGSSLYSLTSISPSSVSGEAIRRHSEVLWSLYYANPETYSPTNLRDSIGAVVRDLPKDTAPAQFVHGLASTLSSRCRDTSNSFQALLNASCISTLLTEISSPQVEEAISSLAERMVEEFITAAEKLSGHLDAYKFQLVRHGLSDLYYLPLRISRILGWCGAAALIERRLFGSSGTSRAEMLARQVVAKTLRDYGDALVAVSDEQSPFFLTFLAAAKQFGWSEEAEGVVGSTFASLYDVKAQIARASLPAEKVLSYLIARKDNQFIAVADQIARPSELLASVLFMAHQFNLDDVVDPFLADLDHTPLNIFLPARHTDFGLEMIEDGTNHSFEIGHGIWTCGDLIGRWDHSCKPSVAADDTLRSEAAQIAALCSALLFPNRTPWFLVVNDVLGRSSGQ